RGHRLPAQGTDRRHHRWHGQPRRRRYRRPRARDGRSLGASVPAGRLDELLHPAHLRAARLRPCPPAAWPVREACVSTPVRAADPGAPPARTARRGRRRHVELGPVKWINRAVGAGIVVFLVVAPPLHVVSNFNLSSIGVQSLWLGIAAVSLIFLAAYGGMI